MLLSPCRNLPHMYVIEHWTYFWKSRRKFILKYSSFFGFRLKYCIVGFPLMCFPEQKRYRSLLNPPVFCRQMTSKLAHMSERRKWYITCLCQVDFRTQLSSNLTRKKEWNTFYLIYDTSDLSRDSTFQSRFFVVMPQCSLIYISKRNGITYAIGCISYTVLYVQSSILRFWYSSYIDIRYKSIYLTWLIKACSYRTHTAQYCLITGQSQRPSSLMHYEICNLLKEGGCFFQMFCFQPLLIYISDILPREGI